MGKEHIHIVSVLAPQDVMRTPAYGGKAQPSALLHSPQVRESCISSVGEPLRECQKEDLSLGQGIGQDNRAILLQGCPAVYGE